MGFYEQLERSWNTSGSMLCVGLDPDPSKFPAGFARTVDSAETFCRGMIDATAHVACAFKPQVAYFASQGAEAALERVCEYVLSEYPEVTLILDAKRGDIDSTAAQYAREAFLRYGAHAVTVNPYLGTDSIVPYFDEVNNPDGGGVIVLCRTSNPGGDDLQSLMVEDPSGDHRPLYAQVAKLAADRWAAFGELALVVGAPYPRELADVRALVGDLPILVPGVGAQGGDPRVVREHGARADGRGLIVNSSRAILYADSGPGYIQAARDEAERTAAHLGC